jgi:hypothetical protein
MADDLPPLQPPPRQKLPRAGQIPDVINELPARRVSNDVHPTRQLPEPTISPPDYRLPQQSEPGALRIIIIIGVVSMIAVLGGLAIVYWWLQR